MATRNIVPRADGEGNIGTALKNWLKGWFKDLFVSGNITNGTDNVTVASVASLGVWGSGRANAESEAESSTTSGTYQQKLRLTTGSLVAGTYRIGYQYLIKASSVSASARARVQLDDTTDLMVTEEEMSDATNYALRGGFKNITLIEGVHNIDLDFNSEDTGTTVYIKQARLEIWRVA